MTLIFERAHSYIARYGTAFGGCSLDQHSCGSSSAEISLYSGATAPAQGCSRTDGLASKLDL